MLIILVGVGILGMVFLVTLALISPAKSQTFLKSRWSKYCQWLAAITAAASEPFRWADQTLAKLTATMENRHEFHSTILDSRVIRSMGRRYARGVTHMDDALYLWFRTLYLGKRGHPLES